MILEFQLYVRQRLRGLPENTAKRAVTLYDALTEFEWNDTNSAMYISFCVMLLLAFANAVYPFLEYTRHIPLPGMIKGDLAMIIRLLLTMVPVWYLTYRGIRYIFFRHAIARSRSKVLQIWEDDPFRERTLEQIGEFDPSTVARAKKWLPREAG